MIGIEFAFSQFLNSITVKIFFKKDINSLKVGFTLLLKMEIYKATETTLKHSHSMINLKFLECMKMRILLINNRNQIKL